MLMPKTPSLRAFIRREREREREREKGHREIQLDRGSQNANQRENTEKSNDSYQVASLFKIGSSLKVKNLFPPQPLAAWKHYFHVI